MEVSKHLVHAIWMKLQDIPKVCHKYYKDHGDRGEEEKGEPHFDDRVPWVFLGVVAGRGLEGDKILLKPAL